VHSTNTNLAKNARNAAYGGQKVVEIAIRLDVLFVVPAEPVSARKTNGELPFPQSVRFDERS
jgi:hypothetical protein